MVSFLACNVCMDGMKLTRCRPGLSSGAPRGARAVCLARGRPRTKPRTTPPAPEPEATDEEAPEAEETEGAWPYYADVMEQYRFDKSFNDHPGNIFGQYTPNDFVTFGQDPDTICQHAFKLVVRASVEDCYRFLDTWGCLVYCFDLIDTIAEDDLDETCAVVQLFYKWKATPPLQIVFSVRKHTEENEGVVFISEDGLPLFARFVLSKDPENPEHTIIRANIDHGTPNLILEWVGLTAFHHHINTILEENMAVLKMLLEGELEPQGLKAYYDEHRLDSYDGPNADGNTDWVPDNERIYIEDDTPPERDLQAEEFAMALAIMDEAVEEGEYIETEQGWAHASLTAEQVDACDELARQHRYALELQSAEAGEQDEESALAEDAFNVEHFDQQVVELLDTMAANDADAEESSEDEAEDLDDKTLAAEAEEAVKEEFTQPNVLVDDDDESYVHDPSKVIMELPSVAEAAAMSEEEEDAFMDVMAEKAGIDREEWEGIKAAVKMDPEIIEGALKAFQRSEEEGRKEAEQEGKQYEEWLLEKMELLESEATDKLRELAAEAGVPLRPYLEMVLNFQEESEAGADSLGINREQYVETVMTAMDETTRELKREAKKLNVSIEQVLAIQADLELAARDEAAGLGLTEEEYVEKMLAAMIGGDEDAEGEEGQAGSEHDKGGDKP